MATTPTTSPPKDPRHLLATTPTTSPPRGPRHLFLHVVNYGIFVLTFGFSIACLLISAMSILRNVFETNSISNLGAEDTLLVLFAFSVFVGIACGSFVTPILIPLLWPCYHHLANGVKNNSKRVKFFITVAVKVIHYGIHFRSPNSHFWLFVTTSSFCCMIISWIKLVSNGPDETQLVRAAIKEFIPVAAHIYFDGNRPKIEGVISFAPIIVGLLAELLPNVSLPYLGRELMNEVRMSAPNEEG